jgi:hypothetical protein
MSHNKNGKTGYGQSGSRKVDGFPARVDGNFSRQLRSHLIARPNEVHEFLRNQYLTCLGSCSSSGIDKKYLVNKVAMDCIQYLIHLKILLGRTR